MSEQNMRGRIHTHSISLRWNDFDRYGHVTNSAYIEIAQQAVALLGQKADLLFKRRNGNAVFGSNKNLPQQGFELVDRDVEPFGGLLQSVRLTHPAAPSPLRRRCFASPGIKLLDPQFNVNVVTARAIFNNRGPR